MTNEQIARQAKADQEHLRAGFHNAGEVFLAIHIEAMFHQIEDENQRFMHNLMAARIKSWIPPEKYRAMIKEVANVILNHSIRDMNDEQKKQHGQGARGKRAKTETHS